MRALDRGRVALAQSDSDEDEPFYDARMEKALNNDVRRIKYDTKRPYTLLINSTAACIRIT